MLDVAAVAEGIWTSMGVRLRQRLSHHLEGAGEPGPVLAWLAAMHDLGKAEASFQAKVPGHRQRLTELGFTFSKNPPGRPIYHGPVTALTLDGVARHTVSPAGVSSLAAMIGGHHGTPVTRLALRDLEGAPRLTAEPWLAARAALAATVGQLLGVAGRIPHTATAAEVQVAGLISVADWIGSDVGHFPPFCRLGEEWRQLDPAAYLAGGRIQASRALRAAGWSPRPPSGRCRAFHELFPGRTPRPAQAAIAAATGDLGEPSLVVIECETGSGKTESALMLSERALAHGGASGLYLALPTQATSNQMFTRIRDHLATRWPDSASELHLLHGNAALSADYAALSPGRDGALITPEGVEPDPGETTPGAVIAGEWFQARKRGLLSPFAVGTIDQALLGILRTRHFFVRLYGLAGSVVVLDEVHAYDAYTGALIERLVHWLAALESTVIVLSATLPDRKLRELEAAYQRGRRCADGGVAAPTAPDGRRTPQEPPPSYPRLSITTAIDTRRVALPASGPSRSVALAHTAASWSRTPQQLVASAVELMEDGGCVAVVCNTVAIAQATAEKVRRHLPTFPLLVLHARMRFVERDTVERELLAALGPGAERPETLLVVATQVIEQSLDIDFDGIVTLNRPG